MHLLLLLLLLLLLALWIVTLVLFLSAAITPYLFPILPLFVRFRLLHIVMDLIMFSSLPMLSPRIISHGLDLLYH